MHIYGLFDPTDVAKTIRYVGYTAKKMQQRINQHCSEVKKKSGSRRNHWIRSLLAAGHRPGAIVLEDVTAENWEERERYWIAFYAGDALVNATIGGMGLIGPSADVRARISRKVSKLLEGNQRRKGIPHSEETKRTISTSLMGSEKFKAAHAARRGKPGPAASDETRQKIRLSKLGVKRKPFTDEHRRKMTLAQIGKKQSQETIAKRAAKQVGNQRSKGRVRPDSERKAIAAAKTGSKMITDGVSRRFLIQGQTMPDGWRHILKR